jgi:hypothetical protein
MQFLIHHADLPTSLKVIAHQLTSTANQPFLIHLLLNKLQDLILSILIHLEHK